METQEITISVSPQAANVYHSASEEERRKLELLVSLKLDEIKRTKRPLEDIMDEISHKAQKQGLTPEVLDAILNEQ